MYSKYVHFMEIKKGINVFLNFFWLRNFAKGRSEAMGDMRDPVAKLGDHIVDHFTNEKIVLMDAAESARAVC